MGDICSHFSPDQKDFKSLEEMGLNVEDCCKCDGQGLNPLCPYREMVPENFKNYEERYLYHHFRVIEPVRA